MNWLDLVIVLVLLGNILPGYRRGFVLELAGLVSLVLGIYAAYLYSPLIALEIMDRWQLHPVLVQIASFLIVIVIVHQIILLLALAINRIADLPVISMANRLVGACFGIIKGGVVVVIALTLIRLVPIDFTNEAVQQSYLAGWLMDFTPFFYDKIYEVIQLGLDQYKYVPPII